MHRDSYSIGEYFNFNVIEDILKLKKKNGNENKLYEYYFFIKLHGKIF